MRFDHALMYLGDFGRYQKIVYFTLCVMSIPTAWHSLGNTFLSASPDHQCRLYDGYTYNASKAHDGVRRCTIPQREDGSWDNCRRYANASEPQGDGCNPDELGKAIPCDIGWVYDETSYERTAVTEWDLVCENDAQRQLSKTLVLVGKMMGSITCGQLADYAGRKKAFTLAILLMVCAGTGASFVTNFTLFLVMQFLLGVSASGTFVVAIVIATEMVGKSQRANAGIIIEYFYSVGYMSMALIAWRLRDWHTIELAISIPPVIFLAYYLISNNLVYYGLSFFTEDLGADPYLSFFISGAVEIPALIVCQLLLGRIGRKWLICTFMSIGGVSLLCAMAIPKDLSSLILAIAMVGKMCISGSYAIVYLYAIELFPTPVRNVGVGMGSFVARIGSIASPYVLLLGDYTFFQFPFLVFGTAALFSGALTLLLPETLGTKLPETLEEGEAFGKGMTLREIFKLPNCRQTHDPCDDDFLEAQDDTKQDEESVAVKMNAVVVVYCNVGMQTDDN